MLRSYKYRLYPLGKQEARLKCTKASLCNLYNELRSEKVERYKKDKINLSKTDLRRIALAKRFSSRVWFPSFCCAYRLGFFIDAL
jgi:transposase